MKSRNLYLSMVLVCILLLAACSTQQSAAPTSAPVQPPKTDPATEPTATSEPTTPPPTPTLAAVPTLPPAEATITFEGKGCSYNGPQPIPANMTFTVNWYVNSSDYPLYGLYVFIVGDGMTKDDLVAAIKNEGAPPSWLTQAGSFDAEPHSSQQVTVKTADGLLSGPLYFVCFFTENGPFQTIGPIDVQ